MAEDFYPFVDAVDEPEQVRFATRIAIYDDMLSTPRVVVVGQKDVRSYLEEVTNTVYRSMKEQGGSLSLMIIREIVENFIHANFTEPVISILDGGNTVRFADQGPGIEDKERAFEFGVTSANRVQKRYIRGTGAGFPMVQQYLENAGGAISIEDNLGSGTVVTVTIDHERVKEISGAGARGAAVRGIKADPLSQIPLKPNQEKYSTTDMWTGAERPSPQALPRRRTPYVTERGMKALSYAEKHGHCGPTELSREFGSSTPTWSRELEILTELGFMFKQGQKRFITEQGEAWLAQKESIKSLPSALH